jgi:hypothetical protein
MDKKILSETLAKTADVAWGYFTADGRFFEVPKVPLLNADLFAPCDVMVHGAVRHIVVKPKDAP